MRRPHAAADPFSNKHIRAGANSYGDRVTPTAERNAHPDLDTERKRHSRGNCHVHTVTKPSQTGIVFQ